jgi:hypothetical protein
MTRICSGVRPSMRHTYITLCASTRARDKSQNSNGVGGASR